MINFSRYLILLLIFCALMTRGIYYHQFRENPYFDHVPNNWDQTTYNDGAKAFAKGDILAVAPNHSNPFSPLYQYFLGILYWLFGINLKVIWLTQFLLGTISTLLVYAIGRYYFQPVICFIAALLFNFYGVNWMYEGALYRASFITFLELMSCFMLIRFANCPTPLRMTTSAGCLSLLIQSKTNLFLLLPFTLIYIWKKVVNQKERGWRYFTGFLIIFLLLSAPLLIWVNEVRDKWGFYDRGGPETLLLANVMDYSGRQYVHTPSYDKYLLTHPLETLPVLQFILKTVWYNPFSFLQLYLRKIFYCFNNYELPTTYNFYLFQKFSPILIISIPFAFLSSLGIIGSVLLRKNRKNWTLLHGYFFANLLMILPFYISSRFRLPIVPILSLFAAYTLWTIYISLRKRKWYLFSIISVCWLLISLVVKTYPLPEGKIRIYDYANVGSAYLSNNNLKDDKIGFSYYQKAWSFSQSLSLELRKSQYLRSLFSNYYYKQTFSYLKKDDVQRGLDAVKKAISADYSSASNHDLYAEILYNNKNYREAFSQALKAIALNLDSVNSHLLLGEIYSKHLGRPFWAIYHWQKAQSLTDGSKNEKLTIKIKHIQNQLRKMGFSKQSSTTQNLDETKILLRTKTPPPSDFLLDLTFPSDLFNRSIDEIDQYLIKLYQYLNLAEEKKKAHIYYQIGMLYWKLKGRQNAAYHYFNIAWNLGLHFPRFENLLDQLYANQTKQPIP